MNTAVSLAFSLGFVALIAGTAIRAAATLHPYGLMGRKASDR